MIEPLTQETIAAGAFGAWLAEARASLHGNRGSNVPCGDCVGCCVSSYFIPVRPEDKDALDAIPARYLVNAPNEPLGQWLMGYREDGTCPMLSDNKCTIYGQRPQTCRDYDCRVFAAAGIDAGGDEKHVINRRVRAWRFSYPSQGDHAEHEAVKAAATFIATRRDSFPGGRAPTAPTGIAVLAVKVYSVFMDPASQAKPDADIALSIIAASREFDSRLPEGVTRSR
ncbi:MAG: YkgJ family cysteine cluster protein [Steroidobacteraceae bacterium]